MFLESPLARFALSGTLIACYGVVDALARRRDEPRREPEMRMPRWVHPAIFASIGAFYLLIRPFGGPLGGGWGNALGVALAGLAMILRWSAIRPGTNVRYPRTGARVVFYVALPIAAGVPLGLLALTLPACALSAWCTLREDVRRAAPAGARWIAGIW
jgi:hypothetical protein